MVANLPRAYRPSHWDRMRRHRTVIKSHSVFKQSLRVAQRLVPVDVGRRESTRRSGARPPVDWQKAVQVANGADAWHHYTR